MNRSNTTSEKFLALKEALQQYQIERLRQTFADIEETPEYTRLAHFFYEEIYGHQDFGFRTEGIKTLHHKLSGLLKGEIIEAMGKVIELNELSDTLDDLMVEKMAEMGIQPPLDERKYQEVYRSLDNYEQRVYQINLLIEVIKEMHHISRMRFIGLSLKVVSKAAHVAGFGKIMDFLYAGYEAFHSAKDIDFFAETIRERELAINRRLFGK